MVRESINYHPRSYFWNRGVVVAYIYTVNKFSINLGKHEKIFTHINYFQYIVVMDKFFNHSKTFHGIKQMAQAILELQLKLRRAWLKLLKAEAKRKEEKVAKWEQKVIQLELAIKKLNR